MGMQNISIYRYRNDLEVQGNPARTPSYLGIGKKGQVVQGVITHVGNGISINFNGIEVAVAKNAVKNASEGETRNFKITDISKDSIVLQEVDGGRETEPVRSMMSTSVDTSGYSFAECMEAGKDTAQAKADANESLTVLDGGDYQRIEEEEGSLTERTKECIERAAQRHKERKEWVETKIQEGIEFRDELEEGLKKIQAAGFLSQKSEGRIRQILQDAGIPVTADILDRVVTALKMSQSALDITDQSKAYLIERDLAPTIENLYQGKYSASAGKNAAGGNVQDFEEYRSQIEKILEKCGRLDGEGMECARWLFEHELPVNESTLAKLEMLNELPGRMTADKVLEQIVFALTSGSSPRDAVLDDSQFVMARDMIQDFQNIEDSAVIRVADALLRDRNAWQDSGKVEENPAVTLEMLKDAQEAVGSSSASRNHAVIPAVYAEGISDADILKVTLKRQLEEIRQKMTLQSAVAMQKKGIHIDTEPLENMIKMLREMENAYYSGQVGGGEEIPAEELDLLQETLGKTGDIARTHAALLGTGVRQQALLTINELHAAASSRTAGRNEWNSVYETVGTQVRTDLGDSIQKAFAGVPSILEDMGLEDTQANERAVRILGYNSMEITEENIEGVKQFDAKVNRVIENMKPATVLELIRRGDNPLDMPLDELNKELEEIQEEQGISPEERYSRFLWQMEKSGQITPEERSGYIGVYRLLNQIQKADGAAIGAVMETGQELTLGNLLTQVRTKKGRGIDAAVDDVTGVKEASYARNSITDQISAGFAGRTVGRAEQDTGAKDGGADEAGQEAQQREYYRHIAAEAFSGLTPSKLQQMTDGDMQRLLNVSLEKFYEELKQASGGRDIQREYFEEQARELREALANSGAAEEYLTRLQVEGTAGNIIAAEAMLEEGYMPYREAYRRRNVLSEERQEELDETIDLVEEAIGDEAELDAQCERAEKIMHEILTKSYEQADISIEDLSKLRKLGHGLRLEGMLRQSRSYDIPIRTGDGITNLNLTIIHGAEESGRIQVSMEDEKFGNISAELKVADGKIKGLVLCDQRQGFETLQSRGNVLEESLADAGYSVKNISYGMDFKSRNELLNERVNEQEADTGKLYQISKILVRAVMAAIREQ